MGNQKDRFTLNWFIAAGVVGADIGTSVFYSTGILFPIIGYMAPFAITFVCLMMWFFKRTYEEGIALSPYNGGAYVMILRSIGRRAAVVVGALTCLSYLATASVSALSGAQYLTSLPFMHQFRDGGLDLWISFFPLVFFGLLNIKGIKEPAKIVTGIALFHFALLIIMGIWSTGYVIINDVPMSHMFDFALHWDNIDERFKVLAIVYGVSTAFLGISGFESAAQIVEELSLPLHQTVKRIYTVVVILVSLTAPVISFFCLAILSQEEVLSQSNNLVSALGGKLGGNWLMYIVVLDASLTLFAATNTAYVGFIGLAATMAKQGNMPSVILKRIAHKFPKIEGYPLIALPFMAISIFMSAVLGGEIEVLGKVYGMAFLGVMVSFALGVILMRNRKMRSDLPIGTLTAWVIQTKNKAIPIIPLISGIVLLCAQIFLFMFVKPPEARSLLIELVSLVILVMAYFRWGVLENRLETRSDLRLGLGKYSQLRELPNDLKKYVICVGGTGARRLIAAAVRRALKDHRDDSFELIIFHAEDGKDPQGFFFELLQRVISQQIAPIFYSKNIILTCKIVPGSFDEGIETIKKSGEFTKLYLGVGTDPELAKNTAEKLIKDHEINVGIVGS